MIKFKDLYVSLESETPVPAGPASGFFCWWLGGLNTPALGPVCANNQTPSISTAMCNTWGTVPTAMSTAFCNPFAPMVLLVPGAGVADAAQMPLKDYLKTALAKAAQEPKAIDDLDELERLEGKLSGALEEVRARKVAILQDRKKGKSK